MGFQSVEHNMYIVLVPNLDKMVNKNLFRAFPVKPFQKCMLNSPYNDCLFSFPSEYILL